VCLQIAEFFNDTECGTVCILTTVAVNVKWPVMQTITNSAVIKCNHYEL
jgi:hypothetical protein